MRSFTPYLLLSIGVIFLDQLTKYLTQAYMNFGAMGEILLLGEWLKLHYTLNPGMAFGLELGFPYGKLFLSLFRLIAVFGIAYYLFKVSQQAANGFYKICLALILGGATGNVIDSTFYGILYKNAPYDAPSPWFNGQVIDMIYVDLWEGYLPSFLPLVGGQYYAFWPIFNIADASIFVGVALMLIFQKKMNLELQETKAPLASSSSEAPIPGL